MRYRDLPPPRGYTLVPEVAAAPPDGLDGRPRRTRSSSEPGYRFSDGRPVRADAFAQAINRTLAPGVDSPGLPVHTCDRWRRRRPRRPSGAASGVTARGNTLVIRLTREVRDLAAWTTMPFFCAVPPTLPPSPEGVRTFPRLRPLRRP
jgi:hypothetical protein